MAAMSILTMALIGCTGSQKIDQPSAERPNEDRALDYYLQGSLLDQKGEHARAIIEYLEALRYKKDAAIYHAIAKDYSLLGKNENAIQNGEQAVKLSPDNRTYHETVAEIYLNALNLDEAIKEYHTIIGLDSSYQTAWLNLARLLQMQKPGKALEVYQDIINRFGPDPDSYFQMAQIYNSMNKLDKATDALKGMLALEPGSFEIKKTLGDMYLRRDSIDAALVIFAALVELHPENLEVRAALAHAYLVKQDYDHAAEQFDIVMKKDTLSADEQIRFGQVFVSFIQKDSAVAPYAIKLFHRIQKRYPDDWRPYWFLGEIENVMKDDSSALRDFGKVKEIAKWNPDGWIGVASVYYDKNKFDEAIEVLNEAKKFVPEEFRVYLLLGIANQRKHQLVDAASALEKAVQLNDKSLDALSALALVYDEMKRREESDTIYERALRLDPNNHLILNNYGYSLAERGIELERALKMSKDALAQQPSNQSYLDTYGWIYFQLGDYKEAEQWIRKAIELGSTSTVIHEHLGDIYFKLDDKDSAMKYWQKALEFDSTNQHAKEKIERGSL